MKPQSTRPATTTKVAKLLGVSPPTIVKWAREGKIPCALMVGKCLRFNVEEVLAAVRPNPKK